MEKKEIQNLIKELVEKITIKTNEVTIVEDNETTTIFSVAVSEPHGFITRDGEGLQALNHLVRRIIEAKLPPGRIEDKNQYNILIDINDFQKKAHGEHPSRSAYDVGTRSIF